jgi:hypothetical protein
VTLSVYVTRRRPGDLAAWYHRSSPAVAMEEAEMRTQDARPLQRCLVRAEDFRARADAAQAGNGVATVTWIHASQSAPAAAVYEALHDALSDRFRAVALRRSARGHRRQKAQAQTHVRRLELLLSGSYPRLVQSVRGWRVMLNDESLGRDVLLASELHYVPLGPLPACGEEGSGGGAPDV